ncbi:hypothetical protein [Streptomyces scabiei]|uniref:hypothetical protein n=1 Tax=Streptomyces scabiei TaxID=1930 RepID=UPI000765B2EA|nr:hypothetical protein [Streptomyces scabiei]
MTSPLTTQQLDEIETRATAATSGPWTVSEDYADVLDSEGHHLASFWGQPVGEFIAYAREDVPALLAEVRRLNAALAEQQTETEKLIRWHREDETAMKRMRGSIERLREEKRALGELTA